MEAEDSLLNKEGWTAGEELTFDVTSDGLTLTSLGGFTPKMQRMITVDLDRVPGLAVTVSRIVEVETIEVRFRDENEKREGCLLESESPGRFLLPLRGVVADGGVHTFFLIIGLRNEFGKGSATFSAIELVGENHPLARPKPFTPYLLSPRSGMTLSDIALDFRWRPAEGAAAYELELAGNVSFSDAHRHVVRTAGGGYYGLYINPIPFMPKTRLHPGTWYWRVRGLNLAGTPGDWSEVRSVVICETSRPQPLKVAISPARPLFLIDNAVPIIEDKNKACWHKARETLTRNWNSLPADIRVANLLLGIPGAGYFSNQYAPDGGALAWCCDVCDEAQKEGIPLLLQIGTWPGLVDKGRYHALALSDVEWILQHYPCVKALRIVEQDIIVLRTRPREERFHYIACLIRLAAAHGRLVVWSEYLDRWIHVVDDPGFMTVMRELREYFVPMWKTTLPPKAHVNQSMLLGLWLSGLVANWGVHADGWWWPCAGFAPHSVAGTRGIPASLYGQMWLTGISAGATVFSFECAWNMWDEPGKLTDKATQVVLPLIRALTTHRLIPDQKTVQDNVKVACTGMGPDFKLLFEVAYGVRNAYQFIPASSRCYWIPILPPSIPVHKEFKAIIDDAALSSAEEIRKRLESCLPMDNPKGTAWTVRIGHWLYVMQSHENKVEEQVFGLDLYPPFARLEGTLDANAYLLAGQNGDKLILHIQKGRGAQCRIRIHTGGGMASIEPASSIPGLVKEWNGRNSFLELKIQSIASVDIRATIGSGRI